MLATFGKILYRFHWFIVFITIVLTILCYLYGSNVFVFLKSTDISDPGSESVQADTLLRNAVHKGSADVVLLMSSKTLLATDAQFSLAATDLLNKLQRQREVASVTSYYTSHNPGLLSPDGHETLAFVELSTHGDMQQNYQNIEPLLTSPTLSVAAGGTYASNSQFNAQIKEDLARAESLTLPIVAILLIIIFNSLVAAILPLFIGGCAILGSFAVVRLLTGFVDISNFAINVVTFMGLGLAIDYSLFIVTRFREELTIDETDVLGALQRTLATAGRTIIFSGITLCTCLVGLLLFPEVFLRSIALGAISSALIAMLSALIVLPTLLAILGRRVNALSLRSLIPRKLRRDHASVGTTGAWYRLAQVVMRRPILVILLVLGILTVLGSPFLHVSFSTPDERSLPHDKQAYIVAQQLKQDFPQYAGSQITIAVITRGSALSAHNLALLSTYVERIKTLPGVVTIGSLVSIDPRLTLTDYQSLYAQPSTHPQIASAAQQFANGDITKVIVTTKVIAHSSAAEDIVKKIRATAKPVGLTILVGGSTAREIDLFANFAVTIPLVLLVMAIAIFVLLFLMTGSVIMPLKAAVLNIVSLSATFGVLTWIFQDEHLQNILGFPSIGSVDSTQIVLIFAIALALSIDYEVFLLSRIKEQFDRTGKHHEAIAVGLQQTGWLITSAAILLAVVVGAFATSKIIFVQEIGVGVAFAVIMDATLVRVLLVPAILGLLGTWSWWSPPALHKLWKRIGLSETTGAERKVL